MRKNQIVTLLLGLLLVFLAGCPSLTEPEPETGTVIFHNDGGHNYMGCGIDYPDDLDGFKGWVAPGKSLKVEDVPAGEHSLSASRRTEGGGLVAEKKIDLKGGETYDWHVNSDL